MKSWAVFAIAGALASALPAWAVHVDIELTVESGTIVTGTDAGATALDAVTGRKLFTGDLEIFVPASPPHTLISGDDPGFNAEAGTFGAGLPIPFVGVDTQGAGLLFWDGVGWAPAPAGVRLHASRNAGPIVVFDTIFSAAGVTNDPAARVGTTAADGSVHEHFSYTIDHAVGGTAVPVGAYLLSLYLTAAGVTDSEPFSVVLNAGLAPAAFQAAVGARIGAHPGVNVPFLPWPAAALLAGALTLAAALAQRKAGIAGSRRRY